MALLLCGHSYAATQFSVQRSIGDRWHDAEWKVCVVTANSITVEKSDGSIQKYKNSLNESEFQSAILNARLSPYVLKAVHCFPTIPPVTISASGPEIEEFALYRDATDIRQREGPDAKDLITLANNSCASYL